MAEPISLAGKVAVVTGAAGALGTAMSHALARAGAAVAGFDVSRERLDRLGADLTRAGAPAFLPLVADVGVWEQVDAAVKQVAAQLGDVNIVVNNAGLFPRLFTPAGFEGKTVRFWESDPAGYLRIMSVNTLGQFFVARAATPLMLAKRWGRIINISTSYDTMLRAGAGAYGPSKGAVEAQSANWAAELEGTGVTVNVLIPGGSVDTTLPMPPAPPPGKQSPLIMQAPLPWLASEQSNGVSGVRFIANQWDTKLPPDQAAKRFTQRAAWPDLAAASAKRKDP